MSTSKSRWDWRCAELFNIIGKDGARDFLLCFFVGFLLVLLSTLRGREDGGGRKGIQLEEMVQDEYQCASGEIWT